MCSVSECVTYFFPGDSPLILSSRRKTTRLLASSSLPNLQMCLSGVAWDFFFPFFLFTQQLKLLNGAARVFPLACLSSPPSPSHCLFLSPNFSLTPSACPHNICRKRSAVVRKRGNISARGSAWRVVITFSALFSRRREREGEVWTPAAPSLA